MWSKLDLEQMEQQENASAGVRSPQEVEPIVTLVRLQLYNQGQPCGPRALRHKLHDHYSLKPLPSERTIARILAKNGLTQGRTGHYPSDREV
jgi:hypothetical protein